MEEMSFERLVRTWLQVLVDTGHREVAALLVDAEITEQWRSNEPLVQIDLSAAAYQLVHADESIPEIIQKSLQFVARGHLTDQNGNDLNEIEIRYRVQLAELEADWREVIRGLIVSQRRPNQGVVTELMFAREGKEPLVYNEMKFGSQSEIRIAQELERRKVLFFPLPLAVRAESGRRYQDHREADFLICDEGEWGILEVAFHPNRYEQDSEKTMWFKRSGILCVQHYTAERCYQSSAEVVEEFLSLLARHRR